MKPVLVCVGVLLLIGSLARCTGGPSTQDTPGSVPSRPAATSVPTVTVTHTPDPRATVPAACTQGNSTVGRIYLASLAYEQTLGDTGKLQETVAKAIATGNMQTLQKSQRQLDRLNNASSAALQDLMAQIEHLRIQKKLCKIAIDSAR